MWLIFTLLILSILIALLTVPILRVNFISRSLLKLLRKRFIKISRTEKQAIEAGSVWWEKTIFKGFPDWQALLDTPPPSLSDKEKAFIDNEVNQVCALVDDWQVQQTKDLNSETWEFIKTKGFFGLNIPSEHGGLGFSASAQSLIVTKLATRSPTLAVTVMVPNSLGPAELILKYGTPHQQQHYLPRLARGEEIPCFALTSEKAGSDATSIEDYGIVCNGEFEGRSCLGLRLNWSKRYITLSPIATLLGLAVKVFDPDGLSDIGRESVRDHLGITCVLVPTHLAGVNTGQRHNPMDVPFQNGPTSGEDVFIPLDYVVGGEKMIGQGWKMLVECLVVGRALSLPALASAASQVSLYTSSAYAKIRYQFSRPIIAFEGIQHNLSEMSADAYSLKATQHLTTAAIDRGIHSSVISGLVKYSSTETSRHSVNLAMDLHAGKAIIQGPRNYLTSVYKSIPIGITVEGANILTRSLIVFSQGILRCHPYLLDEIKCIEHSRNKKALYRFDHLLRGHIRHHLRLLLRVFRLSFARVSLRSVPKLIGCSRYFRRASYLSAIFGYLADLTVIALGSDLKKREMISGRFTDALAMIYTTSATLKYYADRNTPREEYDIVCLVCERSLYRAQAELYAICKNLPLVLSWWARLTMFPLGLQLNMPQDKLRRRVVRQLSKVNGLRNIMSPDIYADTYNALDRALYSCEDNDLLLRSICKHKLSNPCNQEKWLDDLCQKGTITDEQRKGLEQCLKDITQVIRVDSFEKL